METKTPIVRIDHYHEAANKTCSTFTPDQLVRLAECREAICYMTDQARAALVLADVIKKYVFYGRKPDHAIPKMTNTPEKVDDRTSNEMDLIHAILGLLSEGEELLSPLKILAKNMQMDEQERADFMLNLKEELGDNGWYVALGARGIGVPLDEVFDANIRKLNDKAKGRYKGGYSNEAAIDRDTDAEAEVLAKKFVEQVEATPDEPSEFVGGVPYEKIGKRKQK